MEDAHLCRLSTLKPWVGGIIVARPFAVLRMPSEPTSAHCPAGYLYESLHDLLHRFWDQQALSEAEQGTLRALHSQWLTTSSHQSAAACRRQACRFWKARDDWIAHLGYRDFGDLLGRYPVPADKPLQPPKRLDALDAMRLDWARRPGHLNT